MHTIRWDTIGCGNVTEVNSGPALQRAGRSSLLAVMRRNGEFIDERGAITLNQHAHRTACNPCLETGLTNL